MNKCDMTHLYVNMTHEYVDMTTVTVAVKRCLLFDGRRELITQFISQWISWRPIFWYSQRARGEGAWGEGRRDYPTTVTVDWLSHVTHVNDSYLVRKRKKCPRDTALHIYMNSNIYVTYSYRCICHIYMEHHVYWGKSKAAPLFTKFGTKKHWVLEMSIREKMHSYLHVTYIWSIMSIGGKKRMATRHCSSQNGYICIHI